MKAEKILAVVLAVLIILAVIVYVTLPEGGEQVYIPPSENLPAEVEIPEGYKPVENFTDVYYLETENGIRYFWLVQMSDGTYAWQEVDKDGKLILPGHSEPPVTETTAPEKTTDPTETTEPTTE